MKTARTPKPIPPGGLSALGDVELSSSAGRFLEEKQRSNCGSPVWVRRKGAEARDLLALQEIAPRFQVLDVDMRETLRVCAELRVTVPCMNEGHDELVIRDRALLGIRYGEEAIRFPQPGYAFICLLEPRGAWMPHVSRDGTQAVCLGIQLPVGIKLKELVLMTYASLTMGTVQMDETDPAGIMCLEAARWWQQHQDLVPLSHEPFLSA